MSAGSRAKTGLLLWFFALALTIRPVVVTLHNSTLGCHSSAPDEAISDCADSTTLSCDQHALKKIAKQSPRPKYCRESALNQVLFRISKTSTRPPLLFLSHHPVRVLTLRI